MAISGTEASQLLHCDDDGETIALSDVQLWDPIPMDRVSKLRELLRISALHADDFTIEG